MVLPVNGTTSASRRNRKELAMATLSDLGNHPAVVTLTARFTADGHTLYLVGGCVRDTLLAAHTGRAVDFSDLDFTTDAPVDRIEDLLAAASAATSPTGKPQLWLTGRVHGTIAALVSGEKVEITRHRHDVYEDPTSRQPTVTFGESVEDDLARRDLTINAIAAQLTLGADGVEVVLIDPFNGADDLRVGIIRTPANPMRTIGEDTLRSLRALRFLVRFGEQFDPDLAAAITANAQRLEILSAERIYEELTKLMKLGGAATAAALEHGAQLGIAHWLLGGIPPDRLLLDTVGQLDDAADILAAIAYAGGVHSPTRDLTAREAADGERLSALGLSGRVRLAAQVAAAQRSTSGSACRQLKLPTVVARDALTAAALIDHLADLPATLFEARRLVVEVDQTLLDRAFRVAAAAGLPEAPIRSVVTQVRTDGMHRKTRLPIDGDDLLAAGVSGEAIRFALDAATAAFYTDPGITAEQALTAAS
jgi:tRNA nucleotidyltransferase/poly(A) polymerase